MRDDGPQIPSDTDAEDERAYGIYYDAARSLHGVKQRLNSERRTAFESLPVSEQREWVERVKQALR